jgi:hypothetical protein
MYANKMTYRKFEGFRRKCITLNLIGLSGIGGWGSKMKQEMHELSGKVIENKDASFRQATISMKSIDSSRICHDVYEKTAT